MANSIAVPDALCALPDWATRGWAPLLPLGKAKRVDLGSVGALDALNQSSPGTDYVVTRDLASDKTYTLAAKGTAERPVVLRGAVDGGDPDRYPELANCTLDIEGEHVVVTNLRLRNVILRVGAAQRTLIVGNWFYDIRADRQVAVLIDGDCASRFTRVAYNRFSAKGDLGFEANGIDTAQMGLKAHPMFVLIDHNLFADWGGVPKDADGYAKPVYLGRSNNTCPKLAIDGYVVDNLFLNSRSEGPACESKTGGVRYWGNTLDMRAGRGMYLRIRHGRVTRETTAAIGVGQGCEAIGNLFVQAAGHKPDCGVQVRDGYHLIRDNWCVVLDEKAQPKLASPVGTGDVQVHSGRLDWAGFPENAAAEAKGVRYVHAAKCAIGGNRMEVVVGVKATTSVPLPCKPAKCRIAPDKAGRADRNHKVTVVQEDGTDWQTPVEGASYARVPRRLFESAVGPAALRKG